MRERQLQQNKPTMSAKIMLLLTLTVGFLQIRTIYTFPMLAMWIALAGGKLVGNLRSVRKKWPMENLRHFLERLGIQTENDPKQSGVLRCFLTYNFGSQVAVWLYTVLLVLCDMTQPRFLSTNLMTFVNGLSAASVLYLFGSSGFGCSLGAICAAWIVSVLRAFIAPEFSTLGKNLELHDLSFGAGYILLYYIFINRKWNGRNILCAGLVCALILLAFKRIGLAALALTVMVWGVLRLQRDGEKRRELVMVGRILAMVACYVFVLFIVKGWLIAILNHFGIHPMGRNYYYAVLAEKCQFHPFFVGLGRNASATLFTTDWEHMNVGNVHSDVLRMYAECGFIGFGVWLMVFWWWLPNAIEKKFGYRAMEFFVLCTVYTFIVYATDNTELYLVNQYFYMLIPMYMILTDTGEQSSAEQLLEGVVAWLRREKPGKEGKNAEKNS